MDIYAKYHDDNDSSIEVVSASQKNIDAENLIKTRIQANQQLDTFLKDNKEDDGLLKQVTNNRLNLDNNNTKFKMQRNIRNDNYLNRFRSNRFTNNVNNNIDIKVNRPLRSKSIIDNGMSVAKKAKNINPKSLIKNAGYLGLDVLNESDEFKDADKISNKANTLKRAGDIAKKIRNARRLSRVRATTNKIKATESLIKAQQTVQKASSVKAAAASTKAMTSVGGVVGGASSAPVLGIVGMVLLALACIIAFVFLLMTILSNKPNDAGALTGIEREIAISLMNNGYDKIHTAAIMGNMSAESSFNSKALQDVGDFENLEGDNRTNDHGYGLNQMTNGRKDRLCTLAEGNNTNHCDINSQVLYFCSPLEKAETNWNKSLWSNYDCTPISRMQWEFEKEDLDLLTVALMAFWERPSYDPSINHVAFRKSEAQRIFSALNSSGGDGTIIGEAQAIANDNSHGYDYTYGSCRTLNPDVDCSSFVYYSLANSGYSIGDYPFSTYDMGGILKATGFQEMGYSGYSSCVPGDVLWNSGHTEIYMGNGQSIGAHNDLDGKPGDSSGSEVCPGSADQGWTLIYRPPAK